MSSSLPLDVPVKFGPYELTHRFEPSGKLGPAFRATHRGVEGFEKTLLIKQLDPRLSAEKVFLDSLVERVALAVRLHHANIVQVLDLGHAAERYFIATEFVAGCDYGAVL